MQELKGKSQLRVTPEAAQAPALPGAKAAPSLDSLLSPGGHQTPAAPLGTRRTLNRCWSPYFSLTNTSNPL